MVPEVLAKLAWVWTCGTCREDHSIKVEDADDTAAAGVKSCKRCGSAHYVSFDRGDMDACPAGSEQP